MTICINCNQEYPNTIIMNTTVDGLSEYVTWKENNEGLCFRCYLEKNKKFNVNKTLRDTRIYGKT